MAKYNKGCMINIQSQDIIFSTLAYDLTDNNLRKAKKKHHRKGFGDDF